MLIVFLAFLSNLRCVDIQAFKVYFDYYDCDGKKQQKLLYMTLHEGYYPELVDFFIEMFNGVMIDGEYLCYEDTIVHEVNWGEIVMGDIFHNDGHDINYYLRTDNFPKRIEPRTGDEPMIKEGSIIYRCLQNPVFSILTKDFDKRYIKVHPDHLPCFCFARTDDLRSLERLVKDLMKIPKNSFGKPIRPVKVTMRRVKNLYGPGLPIPWKEVENPPNAYVEKLEPHTNKDWKLIYGKCYKKGRYFY